MISGILVVSKCTSLKTKILKLFCAKLSLKPKRNCCSWFDNESLARRIRNFLIDIFIKTGRGLTSGHQFLKNGKPNHYMDLLILILQLSIFKSFLDLTVTLVFLLQSLFNKKDNIMDNSGILGFLECMFWHPAFFFWTFSVSSTYNIVTMTIERYVGLYITFLRLQVKSS